MEALIPCSILGAAGWWWLLRRSVRRGGWRAGGQWHVGDGVFAALVALYFVLVIFSGSSAERTLGPEDIRAAVLNCGVMLFFLIVAIQLLGAVKPRGCSLREAFGLGPAHPLRVCGMAILCLACTWPLVQSAIALATRLGAPVSENDDLVRYFKGHPTPVDLAWVVVLAAIAAPLFEEFVFRGYLYGVMKRQTGALWSALTTALLFAAIHQNPPAIPAYMILGLGLAFAYEITGSLWAPILMHALFNSVSVAAILWFPEWNL